jgi:hypothetical protein
MYGRCSRFGLCERCCFSLPVIESRFLGWPAGCLVTILTELPWLRYFVKSQAEFPLVWMFSCGSPQPLTITAHSESSRGPGQTWSLNMAAEDVPTCCLGRGGGRRWVWRNGGMIPRIVMCCSCDKAETVGSVLKRATATSFPYILCTSLLILRDIE